MLKSYLLTIEGNWPANTSPGHYNRGQYQQGSAQQWGNQRAPVPPVICQGGGQWNDQHRYPLQTAQPPYQGNQQVYFT